MSVEIPDYDQVVAWLDTNCDKVLGDEFYRFIFPDNELQGDLPQDYSHPNAVYLYQDSDDAGSKRRLRRRIMLSDTWEDDFMEYVERNPMTLCSGLSYRGRANRMDNAQRMHALIFDLDGVGPEELATLILRMKFKPHELRSIPVPTFIVTSGTGLHLYYVLDKPLDLYPNIKLQLKALKYDLTFRIWDYQSTSQYEEIQYQGIHQGFRMVGSINNKHGNVVRAFRTGKRVPLSYLNAYVIDEAHQVDVRKPFRPTQLTLDAAKERYPEWYERRIVRGETGHWHCHRGLYEWWKRQVRQIKGGHRYFFLMCLAIYACKCDVSKKELEADMYSLFGRLKSIEHRNAFTEADIRSALETYDRAYYCFTIDDIEKLSGVRINRNKRNGRKRAEHVKIMNFVRDEINKNVNWREGNGRPKGSGIKAKQVYEYRQQHPEDSVTAVAKALGISRPTVYKWWDYVPDDIRKAEYEDQYWSEESKDLEWNIHFESYGNRYEDDQPAYEAFLKQRKAVIPPEKLRFKEDREEAKRLGADYIQQQNASAEDEAAYLKQHPEAKKILKH